jgi:hypothetical protein
MNQVKRFAGIVWMLLAPAVVAFLVWQAADKISNAAAAARANVMLQWGIILLIFLPICTGLAIFGWYSLKGYYDRAPNC